jgi:hypothetical protein
VTKTGGFGRKLVVLAVSLALNSSIVSLGQTSGGYLERGSSQLGPTGDLFEREVLMEVQIWGQVSKPGRYRVPVTTDAVGLISFAGGPTEDAALSRVKLVRGAYGSGQTMKINIDQYNKKADKSDVPMLNQGDVLIVPSTMYHKVMRAASFLSQAAVIITAYLVVAGVK